MATGQVSNVNEQPQEIWYLRAAAARTKGDVVRISTGHADGALADLALADDTNAYMVAVAAADIASGSIGPYVVRGTVQCTTSSDTFTAGNGITVNNGLVENSDAAAEAPGVSTINDFGIVEEAGTTVTTIKATLYGLAFTATT